MGLFRRRKTGQTALDRALNVWYPGIIVRISTVNGEIVRMTSDELYYAARFGDPPQGCDPSCPPGCNRHGWLNLVAGLTTDLTGPPLAGEEFSTVPLKIEIKPMRLGGRRLHLAEAAAAAGVGQPDA